MQLARSNCCNIAFAIEIFLLVGNGNVMGSLIAIL